MASPSQITINNYYTQFQTVHFANLPNGEIYAYHEAGSFDSPVLLLLHGAFTPSLGLSLHASVLASEYHVIAPDMRGFGNTSYKKPFESYDDLVEDIKQFLNCRQISKCFILGWAFGANVAFHFAVKYPTICQRLILVSSIGPQGPNSKIENGVKEKITTIEDMPALIRADQAIKNKEKDWVMKIFIDYVFKEKKAPDDFIDRLVEETMKTRSFFQGVKISFNDNVTNISTDKAKANGLIDQLTTKTLVIHGDQDDITPIDEAQLWKKYAKPGIIEEKIFKNSGHFTLVDKFDEIIEAIQDFLGS